MQRNKILSQDIIDDEGSDSPINDEISHGSQYNSAEEQQNEKSFEEEIKSAAEEEVENNDEPVEDTNNEENMDADDNNNNEQNTDTSVNENNNSSNNNNTNTTKKLLAPCRYGAGCTRGNPVHFSQFSHPCKYGAQCTRKNPQHFIEALHPCPYGAACKRKNPDHFKQCTHPAPGEAVGKGVNTRFDKHFLEACHMAVKKRIKFEFFCAPLPTKLTNTITMPPKKRSRAEVESDENNSDNSGSEEPAEVARTTSRAKRPKVEKKEVFKGSFGLKWAAEEDTLYYLTSPEIKHSKKVAAFDMDDTLVTPKSKAKFAAGRADWRWLFDEVKPKLMELNKDGWNVIIFTNQAGVEKGKTRVDDITGKILDLSQELGFPLQACVATATNHWRKPHTSMWDFFVKTMRKGAAVDMKESVFVGDAAGRPAGWKAGAKKDFSCTDRAFAHNIGLTFLTPDEYFKGEKAVPFKWGGIDPVQVLEDYKKKMPKQLPKYAKDEQELVIMVGQPASGKSTFSTRFLVPNGYVRVNRDTLKTPQKCLALVEQSLSEGKSAVVDNTNPDPKSRAPYLAAAKKHKVPVRCFVMKTPRELAEHMNLFRERQSSGTVRRVPDVGYGVFHKNFAAPSKSEGYSEIIEIDFMPQFDDDAVESWFKNRQE